MKVRTLFTDGTTNERLTLYAHPNAYAAPPGTGPQGETCGSCVHKTRVQGGRRSYNKCKLVRMTHGAGTDILVRMPACSKWETKELPLIDE